jgi:hypothetical protein
MVKAQFTPIQDKIII